MAPEPFPETATKLTPVYVNDPSAGVYPTPGLVTDNVPTALAQEIDSLVLKVLVLVQQILDFS